ncbi:VOC family protein [Actinomadura flavalba]|uniref:VOC family protein n=1 Tax=Actinomadura flavalba TaxID=1120938 RepID=UPI0003646FBA|nr:VOC family protein [Actinomadura flavalba]
MTRSTENAAPGTPTWLDIGVPDIEGAKAFYGTLFGWRFEDHGAETGHYTTCYKDDLRVAAMMPNQEDGATAFWWNVYFATEDADATTDRVRKAGGHVVIGPGDVMDLGRMAVLDDPGGARFGIWQGREHTGAQLVNAPGALLWNDLTTPGADTARAFYRDVFGLTSEPVPETPGMDFTVLTRPDGRPVGGIVGDDGAAPAWLSWFAVEDTDAALERVRSSGGTADAPEDIPWGRTAACRDPWGAAFGVMTPAEEPSS